MIAFLGLGRMGTQMASRLLEAGHELVVWNRTAERTAPLVEAGARAAPTPAEAVRDADLVITMLADPPAVESVLFGEGGVAAALRPGGCLIEMSTIGPAALTGLAARLPEGVDLVDAPVMGSVPAATAGKLVVLAGGAVDRVESVLEVFGRVVRCGESGRGAAVKLVLISTIVSGVTLIGEAFALADALGVPADLVESALAAGPAAGLLTRAMDRTSAFPIALAAKDLGLAAGEYPDGRLVPAARGRLLDAVAGGAGGDDLARIVDHIR
jgi:3-hydroxyisobutyrate dehydrogenase-like beta-hydroxyacid dehydrogenase